MPKQRKTPSPPPPEFHAVDDVAGRLGTSSRHIRRLIERGELPAYRFGRSVRIREQDLERLLTRSRI